LKILLSTTGRDVVQSVLKKVSLLTPSAIAVIVVNCSRKIPTVLLVGFAPKTIPRISNSTLHPALSARDFFRKEKREIRKECVENKKKRWLIILNV